MKPDDKDEPSDYHAFMKELKALLLKYHWDGVAYNICFAPTIKELYANNRNCIFTACDMKSINDGESHDEAAQ